MLYLILILCVVLFLIGICLLIFAKKKFLAAKSLLNEAKNKISNIKSQLDVEKKEASIKINDEIYKKRKDFELEVQKEKLNIERLREKIHLKYELLESKEATLDNLKQELQEKERELIKKIDACHGNEEKIKNAYKDLITKLEQISGMSQKEAKLNLLNSLRDEVLHENEKWIQKVEADAKDNAKKKVAEILATVMQRYSADEVASTTTGYVQLPSEDIKGRIIGKEGRNIKSLEMATGMEFIIGETPEVITISGFNPIRREIAKRSLEALVHDGRINPTKIEETVAKFEKEVDELIEEYGKKVIMELNLQGVHPEVVTLLGKLYFRTSFSQNVLQHCKEVALFSRMIAEELGLNPELAMRAGLFHDIGKALTAEIEGPHAIIGAEFLKQHGETEIVVNAVAAHHEEVPFSSIYAYIVMIADTISASRPGARRETFSTYIKKHEKLEEIANSYPGIKKAYAIQAGREIRVIVEESQLSDDDAHILAREIAKRIESEMNFPGQIKVNVIREKRSIEYAK